MVETTTTAAPTTTSSPQQQAADQKQQAQGAPGAAPPAAQPASRFSRDVDELSNPLENENEALILKYPQNLGEEEHLHWVVFYPLIRKGSATGKPSKPTSGGELKQFISGANNIGTERQADATTQAASEVVGFQTGMAAGLAGKLLDNGGNANGTPANGLVSGITNGFGKLVGNAGNALIGGGVGYLGGKAAGAAYNAATVSLANTYIGETCIALHVSEKLSASYSANWDVADLGGLLAAAGSGTSVIDSLTSADGADYIARKLGKITSIVGGDLLQNAVEASTKRVENPYKQQLFKSMGFRKFAFDYKFSPRNEAEARAIFGDGANEVMDNGNYKKGGILYTFLRHMHPEKSKTTMFLEYPSEFLIVYYYQGRENQFVRKISNCALTNMSIDYGAEGMTSFYDTWGVPTECTIRLEFTELETLTGDRIQKGY
jgi:hypothetical protein